MLAGGCWLTPKIPPNPPKTNLLSLFSSITSLATGASGSSVGAAELGLLLLLELVVSAGRNGALVGGWKGESDGKAPGTVARLSSSTGSTDPVVAVGVKGTVVDGSMNLTKVTW